MAESSRFSTGRTVRAKMLESQSSHTNCAKSGTSTMLTKLKTERPLDSTFHTRSISEELSSSDLDSQCREFWLLLEETWWSRLTTDKTTTRSSSLIQELRPSNLLLKTPSQLISKTLEAHQIFRSGTQMQDGSNSSSMTMERSSTSRMEEPWMFLVTEIEMDKTSSCSRDTMHSTNSGTLSTWMLLRLPSRMVNGLLTGECTLEKSSQSSPRCQATDTLMSSIITLLSTKEVEDHHKSGSSTTPVEP